MAIVYQRPTFTMRWGQLVILGASTPYPKDPCAQIVYTLAPKYLYRDYIKAKVYTICVHGPLGLDPQAETGLRAFGV